MTVNNIYNMPFSIIPKNDSELALLRSYHAHISEQVDEMELHPSHKQDVQKVLTKSITAVTANSSQFEKPKPVSLYTRLLQRLFGQVAQ